MNCREASNLLPLFLDGELDSRQMRAVALHSMRCQPCELELKEMERLQDLVGNTIRSRAAVIDLTPLWAGVERRIGTDQLSLRRRMRARWQDIQAELDMRLPAVAAAAAIAALAMVWYARQPDLGQPLDSQQIATNDPATAIERLDTSFESVSFFNDPETDLSVLWVSDESPTLESLP
jgi:hypothetical protein